MQNFALRAFARRCLLVYVFFVYTAIALADPNDPPELPMQKKRVGLPSFQFGADYSPFVDVREEKGSDSADGAELGIVSYSANIGLPIFLVHGKVTLNQSLNYRQFHIESRNDGSNGVVIGRSIMDLYSASYGVSIVDVLSEKFLLAVNFSYGLYSDLRALDVDDARTFGGIFCSYRVAEKVNLTFGVGLADELVLPFPIPMFGMSYRNDWMNLDLHLPVAFSATFFPHERVGLGVKGTMSGAEFNINDPDDEAIDDSKLYISEYRLGPAVEFPFPPYGHLSLFGGVSLASSLTVTDEDDSEIERITLRDNWFISVGVSFGRGAPF